MNVRSAANFWNQACVLSWLNDLETELDRLFNYDQFCRLAWIAIALLAAYVIPIRVDALRSIDTSSAATSFNHNTAPPALLLAQRERAHE